MKYVCIMGADSSGLVTALLTAQSNFKTILVDENTATIKALSEKKYQTSSLDINQALTSSAIKDTLSFDTVAHEADYFIITGTQEKISEQKYLSLLSKRTYDVGNNLQKGNVVIISATIPLGTTKALIDVLATSSGLTPHKDFFVAYCPERIVPSKIFQDIKVCDKTIGAHDSLSAHKAAEFYKEFMSGDLYLTDIATAEVTKLVEDGYQDIMTAFSHHITQLAYTQKVNPYEVIELANKHPHIHLETPSSGEKTSLMVTYPTFLTRFESYSVKLLKTAQTIIESIPKDIEERITQTITIFYKKTQRPCNLLILGLSANPQCNYNRCSSTEPLIEALLNRQDAKVKIVDPFSTHREPIKHLLTTIDDGMTWADVIIGLVAHEEFKLIDKTVVGNKILLDLCGIFYNTHTLARSQEQFFWPASKLTTESLGTTAYKDATSTIEIKGNFS